MTMRSMIAAVRTFSCVRSCHWPGVQLFDLLAARRGQKPVIDDQQLDLDERVEATFVLPGALGDGQPAEQFAGRQVEQGGIAGREMSNWAVKRACHREPPPETGHLHQEDWGRMERWQRDLHLTRKRSSRMSPSEVDAPTTPAATPPRPSLLQGAMSHTGTAGLPGPKSHATGPTEKGKGGVVPCITSPQPALDDIVS